MMTKIPGRPTRTINQKRVESGSFLFLIIVLSPIIIPIIAIFIAFSGFFWCIGFAIENFFLGWNYESRNSI